MKTRTTTDGDPKSGVAGARATWDRLATGYGRQEHLEHAALAVALRLARPVAADRMVDLATGTGAVLRATAGLADRPEEAVGVDRSPRMLSRVGSLPPGWRTVLSDARSVPELDGTFTLAVCSYLLHLLPPAERLAVLEEAHRLLQDDPAARLVVVTVWADPSTVRGRFVGGSLRALAAARPAAWGGLRPLDPAEDLRAAGFVVTDVFGVRRGGYPSLVLRAVPC